MGTSLILVGLLYFCGLSFGQECKRNLLKDVEFPGSDIRALLSPDVLHCQYLCTQQPNCHFFTFLRADWRRDRRNFYCYLKSTSSGKPTRQKKMAGVTSGYSLKPCKQDPTPCLSQMYNNVDFPGKDYRSLWTIDQEECRRACTADPGCQYFTYLKGNFKSAPYRYKCHLKYNYSPVPSPKARQNKGLISGFSTREEVHCVDTKCNGKIFPRIDFPSYNIQRLYAASAEHCQALCSAHPRCTYFSYLMRSYYCYLKHNLSQMRARRNNGVTSGMPARFCGLSSGWMKKAYNGMDFPGNDMRYVITDNAAACQKSCSEDYNCQFYTYVPKNHRYKAIRGRCFMKRVITMFTPPRVQKLANVISGFSLRTCQ